MTSAAAKEKLLSSLKQAELKDMSAQEIKTALSMEDSGELGTHGADVMGQVNELALDVEEIFYNSPVGVLYEESLKTEKGSAIVSSGALAVLSGKKMGRSPLDKRVVFEESSADDIWWGKVNVKLNFTSFLTNRERAVDYLNTCKKLYVI